MKKMLAILSFAIAAVTAIGLQNVIIRGDVPQQAVIIRGDVPKQAVIIRGDVPKQAVIIRGDVPKQSVIIRGDSMDSGDQLAVIIRGGSRGASMDRRDHTPNEHSAIKRGLVLPNGKSVIIRGGFTA